MATGLFKAMLQDLLITGCELHNPFEQKRFRMLRTTRKK